MGANQTFRRASVIYRRYSINGVDREIASVPDYVESVAEAIGALGLSTKVLMLSYPISLERSDAATVATLELVDPDELSRRLHDRVCFCCRCRPLLIQHTDT